MGEKCWFYSMRGQVMGPVTIDQMRQLAASGLLDDGGKVRHRDSSKWSAPSQIPELQSAGPSGDSIRSVTQDAVNRQVARERKRNNESARQTIRLSRPQNGGRTLLSTLFSWLASMFDSFVMTPLLSIPAFIWKTGIGVVVIGGVVFVGNWLMDVWSWKERATMTVEASWDEYVDLREAGVTDDVWKNFRQTVLPRLEESATLIKERIGNGSQVERDLLRMARDILPNLIRSAPKPRPDLESQYDSFASRLARERRRTTPAVAGSFSAMERLFLIFDGVVLITVAGWFLIRKMVTRS